MSIQGPFVPPKVIQGAYEEAKGTWVEEGGDGQSVTLFRLITDDDEPFHIGQDYEKQVATSIQCEWCAGIEFHVAIGSYYTAVRCIKCKWEAPIHTG